MSGISLSKNFTSKFISKETSVTRIKILKMSFYIQQQKLYIFLMDETEGKQHENKQQQNKRRQGKRKNT